MKLIKIRKSYFIIILILLFLIIITFLFNLISIITPHINNFKVENLKNQEISDSLKRDNNHEEDLNSKNEDIMSFYIEQYKKKKIVALTFDDGPSEYTSKLVDELKKRNVNVTFFVLGENIEKYNNTLKFQFDTGNKIGIHSFEHKLFTKLEKKEIIEQIDKTSNLIESITNEKPNFIRVPYGSRNKNVDEVLKTKNLTDILWTIDSKDWKFQNVNKTYNYILKYFKGNEIILMHDSFDTSVKTAIKLVDRLLSKKYTFVTIDKYLEIVNKVEGDVSNNNILKQKIF